MTDTDDLPEFLAFRPFVRRAFTVVLRRLNRLENTMSEASDNLAAKITDLTAAVGDALTQVESEIATIKATPAATPDDSAAVNASADKISSLTSTIRSALATAQAELAPATTVSGAGSDSISGSLGNDSVVPAPVTSAPRHGSGVRRQRVGFSRLGQYHPLTAGPSSGVEPSSAS